MAAVRRSARGRARVQRPDAIRDHNEKLAIAEFARFAAPTLVSREPERIQAFIDAERDIVVKRLDVMGGENVFRVRADDPNHNVIVETISLGGARRWAQRYIPEIAQGDKRVILIDGKSCRIASRASRRAGDSRGNLAQGARGVAQPFEQRHKEIAAAVGAVVAKDCWWWDST